MAGLSFLKVVDNATLVGQERDEAKRAMEARQNDPVLVGRSS